MLINHLDTHFSEYKLRVGSGESSKRNPDNFTNKTEVSKTALNDHFVMKFFVQ